MRTPIHIKWLVCYHSNAAIVGLRFNSIRVQSAVVQLGIRTREHHG
jgi:hypothetical protein